MERKKILPKSKFDASKQEEILRKLQQNTEDTVIVQQITEKEQKSIEANNNTSTIVEKTVNLQQNTENTVINNSNTEKSAKIQRITVDMPMELYERMKDEVDDNGQTIKGFVVNLVKSHFKK
jgi:hypothetical protein